VLDHRPKGRHSQAQRVRVVGAMREVVGRLAVINDHPPDIFPVNFLVDPAASSSHGGRHEARGSCRPPGRVRGGRLRPATGGKRGVVVKGHRARGEEAAEVLDALDLRCSPGTPRRSRESSGSGRDDQWTAFHASIRRPGTCRGARCTSEPPHGDATPGRSNERQPARTGAPAGSGPGPGAGPDQPW
jgi:hypothetical protein